MTAPVPAEKRAALRIGVTGGRHFANFHLVVHTLRQMPADATLVHGACSGADSLAAEWWGDIQGRAVEPHPANWDGSCRTECTPGHRRTVLGVPDRCPAAGPYRNQEMVDSGLDLLIAFPGGHGTADMVRRAKAAGVRVLDPLLGAI